jgi:hypothetical protein
MRAQSAKPQCTLGEFAVPSDCAESTLPDLLPYLGGGLEFHF